MKAKMDDILQKIRRLKPAGHQRWTGCCPAHDDKHPSLSIAVRNGKLLMHCHAGCSFESILAALGTKDRSATAPPIDEAPKDDWKLDASSIIARWWNNTFETQYHELAQSLGVSVASVTRLLPAWAAKHDAWAFPMHDGTGSYCGIRLRSLDGKKKCSVRGGQSGIFLPGFGGMDESGPVLIVEGPTDCAAALDMGYRAIGRPDCSAGGRQIVAWLRRNPKQSIVILANRDEARSRPDGTKFYPGQQGAEILANTICGLCRELKIIMPPPGKGKDARTWLNSGGTHGQVEATIRATRPWYRKQTAKAG